LSCRTIVQLQEGRGLLVPDRLLVAVPGVAERHAEHPGPLPLAGGGVERRNALEEVDLPFFSRGGVDHAGDPPGPAQGADVPLHRLVAVRVAELLHQVLPDALQAQPRVELLDDGVVVGRRR
jgi:hypothetical protein